MWRHHRPRGLNKVNLNIRNVVEWFVGQVWCINAERCMNTLLDFEALSY